jgi:hypothetical protein
MKTLAVDTRLTRGQMVLSIPAGRPLAVRGELPGHSVRCLRLTGYLGQGTIRQGAVAQSPAEACAALDRKSRMEAADPFRPPRRTISRRTESNHRVPLRNEVHDHETAPHRTSPEGSY